MRCGECSLNWIHLLTFALLFGVNKPTYGNKATSSPAVLQNLLTFEQDLTVVEQDDGTVTLEVAVVVASNNVVTSNYTVDYATVDGTATTADSDYVATSGTLTFTPNDSRQVFTVTINGDEMFEADETFTVLLSNITGPGSIADGEITITIVNDDTPSAYTWTGAEDTNWGNTNNWDVGQVPGATDSVVVPAVTNAPLINTGFARLGSIEVSGGDLTVASGTILIVQNRATGITVNNGGAVTVNGPLTMSGQQTSGILVEDGAFTVGANSQVSVSESFVEVSGGSTFTVNGTLLVEDAVAEGLIVGSGTTFTIASTGEVDISGSGNNGVSLGDATAQIVNNGLLSVLDSDAFTTIGGTVTNTASSRLIVEGNVGSTSIFNAGSTLQVGDDIARLLFRESVDLAGATVELELEGTQPNTDQDVILFSEAVDLTGANLVLAGSYLPAIGDEFGIHNLAGPNASYVGTYDGLAEGSTLVYNGTLLEISYVGGPIGEDVTLTAIEILTPPENDDLADAIVLNPDFVLDDDHTVAMENGIAATTEANELDCGNTISWWYTFTPTITSHYQITVAGTNINFDEPVATENDLTVAVYTGTEHPLTEITCQDLDNSNGGGEKVLALFEAGTTYYVRAGAKSTT
ncbi:MAG: Calx-beta domain-containing protein, partial [Bacteroidota bacterium]